jgi:hypothetical protein
MIERQILWIGVIEEIAERLRELIKNIALSLSSSISNPPWAWRDTLTSSIEGGALLEVIR